MSATIKSISRGRDRKTEASGDDRNVIHSLKSLLERDLSYIPNERFSPRSRIKPCGLWEEMKRDGSGLTGSSSPCLGKMGAVDLLTQQQESELFLRMNFLKFRASKLRRRVSLNCPNPNIVERLESLISEAEAIRNRLITANMRLVMSIAKKYVSPQHSFDELVSEATVTLMNTVDKFDADRGFRFSTYAYRSIVRNLYRCLMASQSEKQQVTSGVEELAIEQEEESSTSKALEQVWQNIRGLAYSMLEGLDRRERFIIRSRYALGSHRKPRTFQYMADKLGISKERARQLERRAVKKLQSMAETYDRDELFGATLS